MSIIWDNFVIINEKRPWIGFRIRFLKIPFLSVAIVWYSNKEKLWRDEQS
jgi:hypothetical protein